MVRLQIDPASWSVLSRLLDEALDRPVAERAAWIDALDEQFAQLKPQLRELLARAASVETGDFLGTLPKFGAASEAPGATGATAGETIGVYRLVRELGAGGMGAVWLAERADGLFQRPVALKLPHLIASRDAGLAERMAREREILATLDHRNIAKLLDAGITADGQPFLALEYVEGVPIDRFCDTAAFDVRARLKLFRQVAEAVAYAHGKLVVHRDLKPANILVTAGGGVKLLDFGIAKLLQSGEARETRLTEISGRALTPDYASPEQILGEPLTVASDVYSLGVVLYELLAGTRPYKLKHASRGALEDAILQVEPPRLSQVAVTGRRKLLSGDLDTIVAVALKKNPQERYATVNAFAEDIDRYLTHRPVLARPDSRWYRLGKFVTRNKLAVGAGAAVLLAIVGGASVALWQARVAVAERDRAEDVKDFVTAIFRDADPWFGPQEMPSAAAVLKRARQAVDVEFAEASPTRVELLNVLGESLIHLQDAEGASEILGIAAADAERVLGATHPQRLRAHLLLSQARRARGEAAEARAALDRVLPIYQDRATPISRETLAALIQHAGLVGDAGDFAAAIGILRQAEATLQALPGDRRTLELTVQSRLADTLELAGELPDAMRSAARAYEVARSLYESRGGHPDLITARKMYARQLARSGDLRQAIPLFTQSVDEARRVLDPDSSFVAEVEQNAVQWLVAAGDLVRAREYVAHASAVFAKTYAPDSLFLAAMLDSQALVELSARRPRTALDLYERVVAMTGPALGPAHPVMHTQRMNRALSLAYAGRGAEVLSELQSIAVEYPKSGAPNAFVPLRSLGEAQRLLENFPVAADLQRQALEQIPAGPAAARHRSRGLTELGLALNGLRDFANARAAFDEALTLYEQTLVSPTPHRADALVGRGVAHLALGDSAAAIADLEEADAFWRDFDAENRWTGEAAAWLAAAYREAGREPEAAALQSRARRILAGSPFPQDARLLGR